MYFCSPFSPLFISTVAALIASEPKIVDNAASLDAASNPPNLSCNSCAISVAPSNCPLESLVFNPRSSIMSAALSDAGAANFCSITFKDVPASLPSIPASAKRPSTAVVSCIVHPAFFAPEEHCASACVRGSTSVEDAAAAPAKALAASADLFASSPKAPIACTTTFAASPSPIPDDAARSIVVCNAPALMSASVRPPFASSVIAFPASVAEKMVSWPVLIASCRSSSISDIGLSNAPAA